MTRRIAFVFALLHIVGTAQAEPDDLPRPSQVTQQADARQAMLVHLKRHDDRFKSRVLHVDKVWTERIDPRALEMKQRFLDMKLGQKTIGKDMSQLPKAFDQPYRVRYIVYVDDALLMRRIVKESKERVHRGYGSSHGVGAIWSYDGKREMKVFQRAGELRSPQYKETNSSLIYQYVRPLHWSAGIGFGRLITKVTKVESRGDRTIVFAEMNLYPDTTTTLELEIDEDWIARKAIVSIHLLGGTGVNRLTIVTRGTKQIPGGLKVAASGELTGSRVPRHKVNVVSISDTLTASQFAQVVDPTIANETLSKHKEIGALE